MLHTHFKVSLRHLVKSKIYTLINVLGLTVGLSAFFLILQYVTFELSYDRFHLNHARIYRVAYEKAEGGEMKNSSAGTFFGVGNLLKENFTEVEGVVRFYKWPANTGASLMVDHKVYNERNYLFAEPTFFNVFPSLLTQGDAASVMNNPNSIVLSRRLALKMFGTEDAIGKLVARLDVKDASLIVTGIMIDPPANSHLDVDVIIPYDKDWLPDEKGTWQFPNNLTYILLKEGINAKSLEEKLNITVQKLQRDNPEVKDARAILQPLTSIHFSDYKTDEIESNANRQVVYGIGIAGLIILFIAWINYVNLEMSRFLTRSREIGVRRIIGSSRLQLFIQFFVQYTCLTVLALGLSFLLVTWIRPYFTVLTGVEFLSISDSVKWPWWLAALVFTTGSFLTGIYPAWFLIHLNPVASIKGKIANSGVTAVKRFLLTFQLVTSLVLLAFLFVVLGQLDFMRLTNKSMALTHVLNVYNATSYSVHEDTLKKEKSLAFRNKLLQNPVFQNVSTSSIVPGEPVGFTYHNLTKRSLDNPDDNIPYKVVFVDYYFVPVYNIKLLAGRNYSIENGDDNNLNSLIINKAAVDALGFKSVEEALDKEIYFMVTFDWKKYRIIGIIDDYRHESVKAPVYPTVFFLHRYVGQMTYYSILLDGQADVKKSLDYVENAWKEVWPEKPFDYFFADQHYELQYKSEIYLQKLFTFFGGVAVFLACLGVLGLTLYEANSRIKEISIRKVLGASVTQLVTLLTRDNFILVIVSTVLAVPGIYLLSTQWLSGYPVRIEFSWLFIVYPVVTLFLLVMITSILQTIKAALSNPAEQLKHE